MGLGEHDLIEFDASHSHQTMQIQPDVARGQAPSADDSETQDNSFASLQYRHIGRKDNALVISSSFKHGWVRESNDLSNDLTRAASNGCSTDAAKCLYSTAASLGVAEFSFNTDYTEAVGAHHLKAGLVYRSTSVSKFYDVTLQPNSFVQASALNVVDTSPNFGYAEAAFVQDSLQIDKRDSAEYGVRQDLLRFSTEDERNSFEQLSPRVKIAHAWSPRSNAYLYYGRLFSPFSFQNISPTPARELNPTDTGSPALKPQQGSLYEVGGNMPLKGADLGMRIWHEAEQNVVDDYRLGNTNVRQDLNFSQGVIDLQSVIVQKRLARSGRSFVSLTHGRVADKGCEFSVTAACISLSRDWVNADHDQRWAATAGQYIPSTSAWFTWTAIYGSGFSTSTCANCSLPPHLAFDVQFGHILRAGGTLSLTVHNLFDDRYTITNDELEGIHHARPTAIELNVTVGQ